jgi:glycosyltransferase involved in cell wall biosynthesis
VGAIVVITEDVVGERMAGPGIRAHHFARQLRTVAPTALVAAPGEGSSSFDVIPLGSGETRPLYAKARVLVGQPSRTMYRAIRESNAAAVFDLFDPILLELDEMLKSRWSTTLAVHREMQRSRLRRALTSGDLLIAATPQQRDYYQKMPPHCDAIIVPFGIDPEPPPDARIATRTFLWNGGRWPWLDDALAIEAVRELNRSGVPCELLFLGSARPNGGKREALPVDEPFVKTNPEWVLYAERGRWLRSARAVVMLHRHSAEAEMSIRTRFFDALWACVPVIASRGGWVADLVERESLGMVVEPEERGGVVSAMRSMLENDALHASYVSNLERVRADYTWDRVTAPLREGIAELLNV